VTPEEPEKPEDEFPEGDEESAASLAPSPELEEALREAAEAVEASQEGKPEDGPTCTASEKPASEGPSSEGEGIPLSEAVEAALESGELEEVRTALRTSHERFMRLSADFENSRRRALKERQDAYRYGPENLVKALLGTVDNLERAIEHSRRSEGSDLASLLEGVELVQREFLTGLENNFVTEVEAIGKPFDPALHEAMVQLPNSSVPPNTVVDVLQKGYLLRDRLLRPARVAIARAPQEGETEVKPESSSDENSDSGEATN